MQGSRGRTERTTDMMGECRLKHDLPEPPLAAAQAGLSLIEVITANSVLGLTLMGSISSLLGMASLDDTLRDHTAAVRAASSRMEAIMAFDYEGDITKLVDYLGQPDQAIFSVEKLNRPEVQSLNPTLVELMPLNAEPECGGVIVDASDPQRVSVTVSVNYRSRSGKSRSFTLPMTVSSVVLQ